jgi:hypothetical protein
VDLILRKTAPFGTYLLSSYRTNPTYWTQAWIQENRDVLDTFRTPQQVFEFVVEHHPSSGMNPMSPLAMKTILLSTNLTQMAQYADAVAMSRVDLLTEKQVTWTGGMDSHLPQLNEGSFGNMAYIALYHPDVHFRMDCRAKLRIMQDALRRYMEAHNDNFPWTLIRTHPLMVAQIAADAQSRYDAWLESDAGRDASDTEKQTKYENLFALANAMNEYFFDFLAFFLPVIPGFHSIGLLILVADVMVCVIACVIMSRLLGWRP